MNLASGVETIVQGTFVQGDFCPRRLLSKEDYCPRKTIVQGDNCPRRLLSKETIVQVLMSAHALYTGACKKKLSNFKPHYILSLSTGLRAPVYSACVLISTWTIVFLTKVSLDKSLLG